MKSISCLIVDDEPPAITLLEKYVGMIDQLQVLGTSQSAVKAFDMLKSQEIDLMFLDIRMPVLNGIDFIKTLQNPPSIILTTAYRDYAVDGYDLDIVDYLLKPIPFDRFLKAVDRYRTRHDKPIVNTQSVEESESSSNHVYFNINKTHYKVLIDEILHIESLKDYVRIHTTKDQLVVKGNIGRILKDLPTSKFIRIHRSFAVAIKHVSSFNQSEVVVFNHRLPIGPSYKDAVVHNLN